MLLLSAGFQYMTETYIAVQRIDSFLSMPEPPPPVHMQARPAVVITEKTTTAPANTKTANHQDSLRHVPTADTVGAAIGDHTSCNGDFIYNDDNDDHDVVLCDYPDGYVALGGADYDWSTNVEEMAAQVRLWMFTLFMHKEIDFNTLYVLD